MPTLHKFGEYIAFQFMFISFCSFFFFSVFSENAAARTRASITTVMPYLNKSYEDGNFLTTHSQLESTIALPSKSEYNPNSILPYSAYSLLYPKTPQEGNIASKMNTYHNTPDNTHIPQLWV